MKAVLALLLAISVFAVPVCSGPTDRDASTTESTSVPQQSRDETAAIAGVWRVLGNPRLTDLELRSDGTLVRTILDYGEVHRGVGTWQLSSPGKILVYQLRKGYPNGWALYGYEIKDGAATLTYLDETVAIPEDNPDWGPWIAGTRYPSFEMERR